MSEVFSKDGEFSPLVGQVIKTHEFHCRQCGGRYWTIIDPGASSYKEESEHFRKLAQHYRAENMALKALLGLLTPDQIAKVRVM
jgi:hypothetical protein